MKLDQELVRQAKFMAALGLGIGPLAGLVF